MAFSAIAALAVGCGVLPNAFPVAPGDRECVAVPQATCQALAATSSGTPGTKISGYRIRCTAPACTSRAGTAEIMLLSDTLSSEVRSAIWLGGDPAGGAPIDLPKPPVPPTCVGVPAAPCTEHWLRAAQVMPFAQLHEISVVSVGCSAQACTEEAGSGQTIVSFKDGSTGPPIPWAYP